MLNKFGWQNYLLTSEKDVIKYLQHAVHESVDFSQVKMLTGSCFLCF
jgi:hypothetical protein